jgi:hypothetical protein
MTGRGLGYCAGHPAPGCVAYGYGRGRGYGWRADSWYGARGAGRGFRHRYYATGVPGAGRGAYPPVAYAPNVPYPPVDEASALRAEAEYLESALLDVRARLTSLEPEEEE